MDRGEEMNSRQLKVFLVVAEMENFTKAARELNIVQPAVSNTIKQLEEELQLTLFTRKDKSVILTTEGEVLLRNARIIRYHFEKAELEMTETRQMERGEVRLGVSNTLGMYYFPPIIEAFKKKYPRLHFSIQNYGLLKIQQLIEEDQLDMGVVLLKNMSKSLDGCHFYTDEIVACASHSHSFSRHDTVNYKEYLKEPLISFNKGTNQRDMIDEACRKEKIKSNIIFETNLIPLIKDMVAAGNGVSCFMRPVIASDPRIKMIPFTPPRYVQFSMAWKKGRSLSLANQAFVDFLIDFERRRQKK